jgi:type II secretory pathway pseudopilin PulG
MAQQKKFMLRVSEVIIILVILAILAALLLPEMQVAHNSGRRERFRDQLRSVGLACHEYQAKHGCLPPAVIRDTAGYPIHSWRAILSPWLEARGRSEPPAFAYSFNEPWNSIPNRQAARDNPDLYTMLITSDGKQIIQRSKLAAVIGEHTYWSPEGDCRRLQPIENEDEHHILLMEIPHLDGPWSQPNDVTLDEVLALCQENQFHPHGAHALFDDGSVGWLSPEELTAANLRRLLCPFPAEPEDSSAPINQQSP